MVVARLEERQRAVAGVLFGRLNTERSVVLFVYVYVSPVRTRA
jgi:hypothetical protein